MPTSDGPAPPTRPSVRNPWACNRRTSSAVSRSNAASAPVGDVSDTTTTAPTIEDGSGRVCLECGGHAFPFLGRPGREDHAARVGAQLPGREIDTRGGDGQYGRSGGLVGTDLGQDGPARPDVHPQLGHAGAERVGVE